MILVPKSEFTRVATLGNSNYVVLNLISDMCRLNTLTSVTLAGSGHLGSSYSAMEIYVWALYKELKIQLSGDTSCSKDIIFSSKGHDVPALYSVYYSLGIISEKQILRLRKLGGLHGHPDIVVKGIEANSGSLGMGISKARGRSWAKKRNKDDGRVFVIIGDGELQEGQNYEALLGAASTEGSEITVIVDHNKIQSDRRVDQISYLGDLQNRFESFGWPVVRCSGHDFSALSESYQQLSRDENHLGVIIADTIKGKGVSFMESGTLSSQSEIYEWHAGAPNLVEYEAASRELLSSIKIKAKELGLADIQTKNVSAQIKASPFLQRELGEQVPSKKVDLPSAGNKESLVNVFGDELIKYGRELSNVVVFDADLAADLSLREFEKLYPERFIEVGIAEQDMVTMAGAVSREGYIPVVNSFGAFLSARANEQIYNNLTEKTKILYVCHYAGLLPAGPGKSHQSVRDISLFVAFPEVIIMQPSCIDDVKQMMNYFFKEAEGSCMIRLPLIPTSTEYFHGQQARLALGRGRIIQDGSDLCVFAAGPVMLDQVMKAANKLRNQFGINIRVVSTPWLNRIDSDWLSEVISEMSAVVTVEDHFKEGGFGDRILNALVKYELLKDRTFHKIGLDDYPESGDPDEVLSHHGLDPTSICMRIKKIIT